MLVVVCCLTHYLIVSGLSFYSVAMHELGHALGISHSNIENSIMHAQYQRDVLNLQPDDIRAVTKLYGPGKWSY